MLGSLRDSLAFFVNENDKPSGVPWRLWIALLIISIGVFVSYQLSPPSFECSLPKLEVLGNKVSVEFEATNHARVPVTKIVRVSVGTVRYGSKQGGPRYTPLDHQQLVICLDASETKHIRCEFSDSGPSVTNGAEVTVQR
jgi:hypothetical protein